MSGESIPESLLPFARPEVHRRAAEIIRRHSTHPRDIREFALEGLALGGVRRALELGCGFGRFSQALAHCLPRDAQFVAIDSQEANREPWQESLREVGRGGTFLCQRIADRLDFAAAHFDLVAASYSLYFFPDIVPEVARVLAPDGVFLAITHSRRSMRELFELAGIDPEGSPHDELLGRFSAEDGRLRLERHFASVEARPYPNRLAFDRTSLAAFLEYARFKLPMLASDADERRLARLEERAIGMLSQRTRIEIAKDDAVFCCRGPRRAGEPPCR